MTLVDTNVLRDVLIGLKALVTTHAARQHYPGIHVLGVDGYGGAAISVEAKRRHLLLHIGQSQDFQNFPIDSDGLPTGSLSRRAACLNSDWQTDSVLSLEIASSKFRTPPRKVVRVLSAD